MASSPPFPLGKTAWKPWREHALAKIAEQRFFLTWLQSGPEARISDDVVQTLEHHWVAASEAAQSSSRRGAVVERVTSHLDAVDTDLLRLAPDSYVYGQLPGLLAAVKVQLPAEDLRRTRIEAIANRTPEGTELSQFERDLIIATSHAVNSEARRQVTRLRSFKNVLFVTAAFLAVGAIALALLGFVAPGKLPVCFSPDGNIVCPTSTGSVEPGASQSVIDSAMRAQAGDWDIFLVEMIGLLAAALAAATSVRKIRGTSTPFGLPVALAVLKLPTGALTAVLGLVLMRGEFIPGLSALDTSGQIISWAVLLGYSQQVLTRLVDQRAQTVLENFGRSHAARQAANTQIAPTPVPA
jgi:hypothetical protein